MIYSTLLSITSDSLLYYEFPIEKFKIEIADILFRNIYLDFIVYRFL